MKSRQGILIAGNHCNREPKTQLRFFARPSTLTTWLAGRARSPATTCPRTSATMRAVLAEPEVELTSTQEFQC